MNERITQLAVQAGFVLIRDEYLFTEMMEKFAKLIVLECARVVKASSPNGMIGVTAIRIHFGVGP